MHYKCRLTFPVRNVANDRMLSCNTGSGGRYPINRRAGKDTLGVRRIIQ